MKYQIIRYWNGTKSYGRKFDTYEEAVYFLNTDKKVYYDRLDGLFLILRWLNENLYSTNTTLSQASKNEHL